MLTAITPRAIILICLFIAVCMPGCMAFSDSSAMRIEVEVYKGPLSLEPEIQTEELYGYLVEAQNGMIGILKFTEKAIGNRKMTRSPFNFLLSVLHLRPSFNDSLSTPLLLATLDDARVLAEKLGRSICFFEGERGTKCTEEPTESQVKDNTTHEFFYEFNKERARKTFATKNNINRETFADISRTAATMQAAAFRYSTMSSIGMPHDPLARIAATFFAVAASEYGNQIEARADALLKQLSPNGQDRRELPLSTHLREAEPTDFVHLFDWVDGHTPRPLDYVHLNISPNMDERIKIIERLYGDHFWSKINTVYASGRGKTQMAFIKDETGNWNLKSFDNDPTELLDAYTYVAKKALQKAAELAAGTFTGGTSSAGLVLAKQLRDFAADSEPNKAISQAPPAGTLSLTHLRTRLMDKLDPAQFKSDLEKEKELLGTIDKQTAAVATATDSAKNAAQKDLADTQNELMNHRKQVIARWETIFTDHSNLVDILSSTIKKN